MAKIVIDARALRTSSGRYIDNLLEHLQAIDHTNDYVVLLKPADIASWEPTNKRFSKLVCPYKEFTLGEQIGFARQLRDLEPDLVHFCFVQQPLLYRGRVVTTMHDLTTARFRDPYKNWFVFTIKQWIYRWLNKKVARKSEYIITPSQYVKKDVSSYCRVPLDKIIVTYEAADVIAQKPEPYLPLLKKKYILYVGRAQVHKNLSRLVKAFTVINKTHPYLHLVFSGKIDASTNSLRQQSVKEQVPNVVFTDFVSEGQLRWLYQNASVYAFPSLSEGFGLPGLEAMSYDLPVASSNSTCLPEIYGPAAVYFNPSDTQEMANVILQTLEDKATREKLIQEGRKRLKKFSWKRMAEQTTEVYSKALRSPAP